MSALNDRQRRFCELVVAGRPAGRAYQEAGYMVRSNAVADQAASRLLRNVKVVADYVDELRQELKKKAVMTHEDALVFLTQAVMTPVGHVDANHPLCQEMVFEDSEEEPRDDGQVDLFGNAFKEPPKRLVRIKMVSKMDAMAKLIGMMGWNKPQKVELGADEQLSDLIALVRKPA